MTGLNTISDYQPLSISEIILREPVAEDGFAVNQLIKRCPPLDGNSVYCNLLQCTHFADTCVVAEEQQQLIGFTSAYLLPRQPDTLFFWQIAVSQNARGQGLARRMLLELLGRPQCQQITRLETSINPDNTASWSLFMNLAKDLEAVCSESVMFDTEKHFAGHHPEERLLRIHSDSGPFSFKPLINSRKKS